MSENTGTGCQKTQVSDVTGCQKTQVSDCTSSTVHLYTLLFLQSSSDKKSLEKTLQEKEAVVNKLKQLVMKSKKEATEVKNKVRSYRY